MSRWPLQTNHRARKWSHPRWDWPSPPPPRVSPSLLRHPPPQRGGHLTAQWLEQLGVAGRVKRNRRRRGAEVGELDGRVGLVDSAAATGPSSATDGLRGRRGCARWGEHRSAGSAARRSRIGATWRPGRSWRPGPPGRPRPPRSGPSRPPQRAHRGDRARARPGKWPRGAASPWSRLICHMGSELAPDSILARASGDPMRVLQIDLASRTGSRHGQPGLPSCRVGRALSARRRPRGARPQTLLMIALARAWSIRKRRRPHAPDPPPDEFKRHIFDPDAAARRRRPSV